MVKERDRILVVENDPVLADLIARQALGAAGYLTTVSVDAGNAIAKAIQWAPDLILIDMNLPGLSGKDLMVALTSQKINTPVILIASRGQESDLIQTFRLGAADFLMVPVREAEVISAVERVLQQVHERRERERLAQQVQQANQELQTRVRELTAITAVGKAVTSITDSGILMEKILEGAVRVSQADLGWFLLRDEASKNFHLAASHNLPASLDISQGQTWDDGISSLVAISGEPLAIHGEALKRLKIAVLGQAALITPIKAQKQVVGLLVVMRKTEKVFNENDQHLLDALTDYAAISLMNAHLFRAAENRARSLQQLAENAELGEQINNELLRVVRKELNAPVESALAALSRLGKDPTARWRSDQRQWMSTVQDALDALHGMVDEINPFQMPPSGRPAFFADLCEVTRAALHTAQPFAQAGGITFGIHFPKEPQFVNLDDALAALVVTGLVSNAVKYSVQGGQVAVRIEKTSPGQVHLSISNHGAGVDSKETERIFSKDYQPDPRSIQRFGGIGIRLSIIKEILSRQGGRIWLESQVEKSATFHIQIPVAR